MENTHTLVFVPGKLEGKFETVLISEYMFYNCVSSLSRRDGRDFLLKL
jgi:hypothetical protein